MTVPQAFELAIQHHQAGRLADAEALYRQILGVNPDHADALHLLGVIADQAGRHDLAVDWIRRATLLAPNNAAAHSNLGQAYQSLGRIEEATASFRRALQLKPDLWQAANSLGQALARQGKLAEAETAFRRVLASKPDSTETHNELGIVMAKQGRFEPAAVEFRQALALQPSDADACGNLGNALRAQGKLDEAMAMYQRALGIKPDDPGVLTNLASALEDRGRLGEAVTVLHRVLEIQPHRAEALSNLGHLLNRQGRCDEAVAAQRRALVFQPGDAAIYNNLGDVLKNQGRLDEALAAFRRARELKPDSPEAHSNVIYTLHYQPEESAAAVAAEQQRWEQQFGEPFRHSRPHHPNDRNPGRRLRIGYTSPDFRDHVTGRYLLPLLRHHDRENFEIICYSGAQELDPSVQEFRQYADRWRSTRGVNDEELESTIRKDGVDILVDLTQHIGHNRLPLFARRPAPVQVSFAGYPESAGVEAIEYRISDRCLESEIEDRRWEIGSELRSSNSDFRPAERVFLIDSFWCYDPCGAQVEVNPLPAARNGHITFGNLNNFCKLNGHVLKLWARVLRRVQDSRLILLASAGSHREATVRTLEGEGIAPQRVEFVDPCPRFDYLALYHRLDIALDPFPYNGHTTSLDALWMGVPVVAMAGDRPVARGGWSQLSNLGLPEWVAFSEDEFVDRASQLANDPLRLSGLRATLRSRMQDSILMDAPRFARGIETAYRSMWRQWCYSLPVG